MRSARISTNRGEFHVDLLPETAPRAVSNFSGLAMANFYDGVVFHRVVPGFVVQTGCPRGDGFGGPGWTIPDEVSAVPYVEGAVGMARGDWDTGGSQWFVTTSPQPHLVGDYTLFGQVTYGMEVVLTLEQGDQVLDVIIE
ncbi:MAG: peptidylprolyl isomerase [Proteobacteria bacterium]|nr:peptidylprolyl isomerase [Pseudomonadota bacterium]